jgi:uncharacterized protein involved in exopolysaccharide biosynthesis
MDTTVQASEPEGVTLVALANSALSHRRLIAGMMAALFVLLVGWTLVSPRTYTATAWFMPQADQGTASGLAGVVAQFGISVPFGQAGESPNFYADLLSSHELLGATVDTRYRFRAGPPTDSAAPYREGTLVDLYEVKTGRPQAVRREVAITRLTRDAVALSDAQTGTVKVLVTTRWAELSRQVLNRMLDLINAFNSDERRTQAQAERRFVEERLGQARLELRQAEDRMQEFLQRNRDFRNSPQLTFEQARLQRELDVRQGVLATLTQSYEQARIQEVRNTPVITIVQQAALPAVPDRRRLILKGLLALIVGGMFGGGIALVRDFLTRSRVQEPDEYATYLTLRQAALDDIRGAWGLLRSPMRGLRRRAANSQEGAT